MGTHRGAISHKQLDYYLGEFTFRFNRRRSKSRGNDQIVHATSSANAKPQHIMAT